MLMGIDAQSVTVTGLTGGRRYEVLVLAGLGTETEQVGARITVATAATATNDDSCTLYIPSPGSSNRFFSSSGKRQQQCSSKYWSLYWHCSWLPCFHRDHRFDCPLSACS